MKLPITVQIIISIICLFGITFMESCEKEYQHPVPQVYEQDLTINLEMVYKLNTIGGWEYFTGGYNGIVIYRLSEEEFRAFDRACTNDISKRVEVEDPPIAKCEKCESSYLLLDGSVVSGKANYPLKQYQVDLNYPYLTIKF